MTTPHNKLRAVAAVLAGGLLLGPAGSAQRSDIFFDTVEVNVVNVEVVVTDRDGRPVRGLERGDFTLLVDGDEVEISNFFEVAGGRTAGEAEAAPDPGAASLLPRPDTERLQLVVLVDERNLNPANRNEIFRNLRDYLATELLPSDQVLLVRLSDGVEIVQPFTNDPVVLLDTLAELEKRVGRQMEFDTDYRLLMRQLQLASTALPDTGAGPESPFAFEAAVTDAQRLAQQIEVLAEKRLRNVRATAAALTEFTESLAGMRGRKAVLYVSDGMPVRAAEALVEAWVGTYETWIQQAGIGQLQRTLNSLITRSMNFDAASDLRQLVAAANANGVAFYPISAPPRRSRSIISAETRGSSVTGGRGPESLDVTSLESFNLEDSLLRLADGTGGVAFTRSVNIGGLLEQMRRDFTHFYSLGFTPAEDDGKRDRPRKIDVRVTAAGLEVRHLKAFEERDPLERLEDKARWTLHYGFEDNQLGVRLRPGEPERTGRNRYEVPVMVMIPFERLLLLPQDELHAAEVTLIVAARDQRGGVSKFQRIDFPIRIPNDRLAAALTGAGAYEMRLQMASGHQRIAVGVRDHLARVDATAVVEVDVGAEESDAAGAQPGS